MKHLYSLVIVALMVAPVTSLRADNLDDDSSVVRSRALRTGTITVEGGLMILLNKFANASVGANKASIVKMKENLARARDDVKYFEMENEAAINAYHNKTSADWQKVNKVNKQRGQVYRQIEGLKAERDGLLKFIGDKKTNRPTIVRANTKILALEEQIRALAATEAELAGSIKGILNAPSERAIAELFAAREKALSLIDSLPEDITKAKRAANGMRVFQILGNVAIGAEVGGHLWAFYDNSSAPVFMGGYEKLSQEAHDAIYGKIKERVVPAPDPKAVERARIEQLPTRGSTVPQGPTTHGEKPSESVPANVTSPSSTRPEAPTTKPEVIKEPFNKLPPLLDEEPPLRKAPKMKQPKPMT